MKKILLAVSSLVLLSVAFPTLPAKAADYSNNLLMDDVVFDAQSMSQGQIQSFLDGSDGRVSGGSNCLKNFTNPNFRWDGNDWYFGDNIRRGNSTGWAETSYTWNPAWGPAQIPVSTIVYQASQDWGFNPQVLLATLQKEETLVTGAACDNWRYTSAMGYDCPDGGARYDYPAIGVTQTCVRHQKFAGFTRQVLWGAWQLKFNKERALGNTAWDEDGSITYPGYMTQGNRARCQGCTVYFFDGYATIDGQSVHMDSGATASLYSYTPHLGQSFPGIFEGWFGSVISSMYYSCHNASNIGGVGNGAAVVPTRMPGSKDRLTLTFRNNTGSACVEAHTWNPNLQNWYSNIATNHPAVNPADTEIISANLTPGGNKELVMVKLANTTSGHIEIHTWDFTYQHWYSNIATNHPAVNPADCRVIAADIDGDGRDELILVKYRNTTSGKVEVHTWLPGQQGWYSNIATNLPAIDPADGEVIAANTANDGDSKDKLIFVHYRNTASGKVEVHTWLPGQQGWYSNIATNHPAVDPADVQVIAANTANDGDSRDKLILVKLRNTVSGKVEIHTWLPGQQNWYSNIATNLPAV